MQTENTRPADSPQSAQTGEDLAFKAQAGANPVMVHALPRDPVKKGGRLPRPKTWASYLFTKKKTLNFFWLNLGTLLIAVGIYFFKFPNRFNNGGVSGLALVLGEWFPHMNAAGALFWLNNLLLLAGYLIFGKSFGFKTAYSSISMSGMIWVMEKLFPLNGPLTHQPLLELIFAVVLPGLGGAILFNTRASNGGTDILGMILQKYTNLNIGTALGLVDFCVTLLAFPAFGVEIGLYSLLGLLIRSTVIDYVIESLNLHKYYTIITTKQTEVVDFITHKLHRSATIVQAQGGFSGQPKVMVMSVLKRSQGVLLQHYIHEIDPQAFLFITNTSEIIGKGFGGAN